MKRIAPSLLSSDFSRLGEEIHALKDAGADWIHVDVMDGHFVPNMTLGPPVIQWIRKATDLPLDVHLMIENPGRWVERYAQAGANSITVHVEADPHLDRTLAHIKELGCLAGVSLNPSTSEDTLKYIIDKVDLVLVMTVNPGFGNQKFIAGSERKVAAVKKLIESSHSKAVISVDGGIDLNSAPLCSKSGADIFVAGAAIFKTHDYKTAIAALRNASERAA